MEPETALTIGSAARLAGVTVRTLHHYDKIGLVSPREHTDAGYRLYGHEEMERLQEVLFFRELGFGLGEIARTIQDPGYDRTEALERQRESLLEKSRRLVAMVEVIDRTIETDREGTSMAVEEMFEVFGGFDPTEHEAEAEDRWGDTEAHTESNRRVAKYSKQDWLQLTAEADAINTSLLDLMAAGTAADSLEAMDLAERHRAHITKWFFPCASDVHSGIGQMYVTDPRFKENIDKSGEGLSRYLSDAIAANHQRT
jgi:DNA-binding transcriptional MerR regulator